MEASATLMAHTPGTRIVTPEELEVLPAPVPLGRWHRPVAHADLVNGLRHEADRRGLEIVREEYALANKDQRLFGILEFDISSRADGIENRWSFGFRNSLDQSIAIQGVAGTRTVVCDNLLLKGDSFVLSRKNTLHVRLDVLIQNAYGRYLREQEALNLRWRELAGEGLTEEAAKALILDAFVEHKVAAVKYLPAVVEAWKDPAALDTEPRHKASLLGAFTRAFKAIKSSPVRWGATQKVARVFGA